MDKTISERLNKDVLTYKLITTAVLVDRLKINGSLARRALADLEERGVIKKLVGHSKLSIYSTFHIDLPGRPFRKGRAQLTVLQRGLWLRSKRWTFRRIHVCLEAIRTSNEVGGKISSYLVLFFLIGNLGSAGVLQWDNSASSLRSLELNRRVQRDLDQFELEEASFSLRIYLVPKEAINLNKTPKLQYKSTKACSCQHRKEVGSACPPSSHGEPVPHRSTCRDRGRMNPNAGSSSQPSSSPPFACAFYAA